MKLSQGSLRFLPAFLITGFCALSAAAQTAQTATDLCTAPPGATFEVASIHEMKDAPRGTSMGSKPDQFSGKGVTVFRLLLSAFDLHEFQIAAQFPDWARSTRYEISAKIEPPEPAFSTMTDAEREVYQERYEQRLRSLLAERFALKCHMETKEQSVYELVVAKGGLKMTTTKPDAPRRGSLSVSGNGLKTHAVGTGLPTLRIAALTSDEVGRLVIDKTGLTGSYDFQADWVRDLTSASPEITPGGPSFFTAIEEQLGLKLVPAKAPVPVLVVDHIQRPTEN